MRRRAGNPQAVVNPVVGTTGDVADVGGALLVVPLRSRTSEISSSGAGGQGGAPLGELQPSWLYFRLASSSRFFFAGCQALFGRSPSCPW